MLKKGGSERPIQFLLLPKHARLSSCKYIQFIVKRSIFFMLYHVSIKVLLEKSASLNQTFFWSSISRYFYCDISCHDISVSFMTLSHKLSFYDIYYETICSAFALLKKSSYDFAKSVAIPQVVSLCFRIFVWCDFSIGATASSCAFGVIFVQFIKLNGWR